MTVGTAQFTLAMTPGCIHAPIGTQSTRRDHRLQTLKPTTRVRASGAQALVRPGSTAEARSLSNQP